METNEKLLKQTGAIAESHFLVKVFLWMSVGLFLSAASAFGILSNPALLRALVVNKWAYFGIAIVQLGLVLWINRGIFTMSVSMARSAFAVYSILNGPLFALILLIYTGASIISTFAIASGTFLLFSVYGLTTRQDLTRIGQLAVMGVIGIIIASVVNFFLMSSTMTYIISYVGIAIFVVLIAWQTQQLKAIYQAGFEHPEMRSKTDVLGALTLYIALINLFILLLNLFGRRR